jgi:hypothetical protein
MKKTKKEKEKKIRLSFDLSPKDIEIFDRLTGQTNTKSAVLKAILRIMDEIDKETVYLCTSEGSRIPKGLIVL